MADIEQVRAALSALDVAIASSHGTRVSLHLTRARQLRAALASQHQAPGRNPLLAYGDSYRDMARMGDGKVDCLSVAIDIENNMVKHAQPQAPAAVVPDGFVLVPLEPTDEMLVAAYGADTTRAPNLSRWRAMIAAAPGAGGVE